VSKRFIAVAVLLGAALALLVLPLLAAGLLRVLLPAEFAPRLVGLAVTIRLPLTDPRFVPKAAWSQEPGTLWVQGRIEPLCWWRARWLDASAELRNATGTLNVPFEAWLNWRLKVHASIERVPPLDWPGASFSRARAEFNSEYLDSAWSADIEVSNARWDDVVALKTAILHVDAASASLVAQGVRLYLPRRKPFELERVELDLHDLQPFADGSHKIHFRGQIHSWRSAEFAPVLLHIEGAVAPVERTAFLWTKAPTFESTLRALTLRGPNVQVSARAVDGNRQLHLAVDVNLKPSAHIEPLNGQVDARGDRALAERIIAAGLAINSQSDQAQRDAQGRATDFLDRARDARWINTAGADFEAQWQWYDGVLAPRSVGASKP